MYAAGLLEVVRRQRSVKRVVAVCGDENVSAFDTDHHGRVVKIARRSPELNYIARLQPTPVQDGVLSLTDL